MQPPACSQRATPCSRHCPKGMLWAVGELGQPLGSQEEVKKTPK